MKDKHTRGLGLTADSPVDRLRRDLAAFGRLDASHVPATKRLTAELGDDLYAAVLAELDPPGRRRLPALQPLAPRRLSDQRGRTEAAARLSHSAA